MLMFKFGAKIKGWQTKKIGDKIQKMYEKGKMALNENKLSKETTSNFTICTFFCYIGNRR